MQMVVHMDSVHRISLYDKTDWFYTDSVLQSASTVQNTHQLNFII